MKFKFVKFERDFQTLSATGQAYAISALSLAGATIRLLNPSRFCGSLVILRSKMGSDNIDKKVKKKEKKEKTKLVEEDVAEDASKVKKKKRKELEAEDEAAAPVDDGEKKKKKKKKDKVVEEESEEDVPEKKKKKSTTDEGAVKKGKCRQSRGGDFTFTEHPAIVAMTSKARSLFDVLYLTHCCGTRAVSQRLVHNRSNP